MALVQARGVGKESDEYFAFSLGIASESGAEGSIERRQRAFGGSDGGWGRTQDQSATVVRVGLLPLFRDRITGEYGIAAQQPVIQSD